MHKQMTEWMDGWMDAWMGEGKIHVFLNKKLKFGV